MEVNAGTADLSGGARSAGNESPRRNRVFLCGNGEKLVLINAVLCPPQVV